jgi:hypothetical protein
MKKFFLAVAALLLMAGASAQVQDTVIINLAKTSKVIFTIEDPEDLEILRHYDFQQLFEDILQKVEDKKKGTPGADSAVVAETREDANEQNGDDEEVAEESNEDDGDTHEDDTNYDDNDEWTHRHDDGDDDDDDEQDRRGRWHRTWQTFNFDLGTNNYLEDKKFPSDDKAYAVRPWGSWYVGLASVQRSRIAKKIFLEWGLGINWYTFKFQNDNTIITEGENGVTFSLDNSDVDFRKSKLSISYVQASLIPVIDFGDHGRKPRVWDGYNHNSFRIGFGPYVGYRIGSHSKVVYNDEGRERDKNRDGFYLNNFRYGARLQVGYRSTDLFFNYDLNELFQDNKGPKLNAFSFGVIF